jgi:hypothetical protein
MKRILSVETHLHRTAAAALVMLLAGCAPHTLQIFIDPATTPTATAGIPQMTSVPAEPTITATPAEPTPTATLDRPPASMGNEWLLIQIKQGLWMARPDGSQAGIRIPGRSLFAPGSRSTPVPAADGPFALSFGSLSAAVSSADGLFAYLSAYDPSGSEWSPPYLMLNIVSLLGRGPAAAIPLTSTEIQTAGELADNVSRAVIAYPSFAWSPDGKRLAFIGAQAGPSADLYEYYRDSDAIVRLTDGPDQAYRPQFSPDGKWIVHAAEGPVAGSAGTFVTGFYAARADGGGVISLYDIAQYSSEEVVDGWLDEHTLVARSRVRPCLLADLRLVDLDAQKADLIFDGCVSNVAVGPGVVLFAQSDYAAAFDENPRLGLYILTASDRTPRLLSDDNIQYLKWAEGAGVFLALTWDNRLLEISPAGDIRELPFNSIFFWPTVSPNGRYWVSPFNMPGISIGEYGKETKLIFDGQAAWNGLLFSPAGDALYFLAESGDLYRAQAPDWAPALLATGLTPDPVWSDMAWMEGG